MQKRCVQPGVKPFKSNQEIMDYAKTQVCCRPGFSPGPDHSILVCEGYVPEKTKFDMQEFLDWLSRN